MNERRIRITLRAELYSPLHIAGPGRNIALVDRPIDLDAHGYPLIPASSIRGRIRAQLERLLRTFDQPICTPPSPEQTCPHHWTNAEEAPSGLLCIACEIFGSAWYHSGLVNSDLRLIREQHRHPDLLRMERTSLAVDRRLGTASSQRLFTIESTTTALNDLPLCFQGNMSGRLSNSQLGWLLAAIRMVVHAGGSKSRGMGLLRLTTPIVSEWKEKSWQPVPETDKLIEEVLEDDAN